MFDRAIVCGNGRIPIFVCKRKKTYILCERFSQDILENYFGTIRMKWGRYSNCSAQEVLCTSASVRVQGSQAQVPVRGNCTRQQKRKQPKEVSNSPVPKRARLSSEKSF